MSHVRVPPASILPPAALVLLAVVLACSSPEDGIPTEGQTGAQLYRSQNCALCHGADGTSAFWRPGPDLLPLLPEWTVDELSLYLLDPDTVAARVDRLTEGSMPAYPHLDEASRRRLATYVLTLGDASRER